MELNVSKQANELNENKRARDTIHSEQNVQADLMLNAHTHTHTGARACSSIFISPIVRYKARPIHQRQPINCVFRSQYQHR